MAAFGRVSWTLEMNRIVSAFSAAALISLIFAGTSPAAAQAWLSIPANPKVDIAYVPPASQRLEGVYQALKGRQVLEELQHFLAPLRLPHHLLLQTRECSQVNAFYSPFDRSLTICYELVGELIRDAPQTVSEDGFITHEAAIVGTLVGVVLRLFLGEVAGSIGIVPHEGLVGRTWDLQPAHVQYAVPRLWGRSAGFSGIRRSRMVAAKTR
jgi:hypothetical protein